MIEERNLYPLDRTNSTKANDRETAAGHLPGAILKRGAGRGWRERREFYSKMRTVKEIVSNVDSKFDKFDKFFPLRHVHVNFMLRTESRSRPNTRDISEHIDERVFPLKLAFTFIN